MTKCLRDLLSNARLGTSYELPGLTQLPVDMDLEDTLCCAAAEGLVRHGDAGDVVEALHLLLDNGEPEQRRDAAHRLGGDLDDPHRRMVTLARHLDDTDPQVAIAAAESLGRMGEAAREAIFDLEHELEIVEDARVREAIAKALRVLRGR